MGLETFTGWIKDLVSTNPAGTDPKSEGDDHLRGLKSTLKTQFSGLTQGKAITVTEDQLNDAGKYSGSLWRRNLLINGGFDTWQRTAPASVAAIPTYTADRWVMAATGANLSVTLNSGGLQITGAAGNTYFWLQQRIEQATVSKLASSQSVTLSFYCQSTVAKTLDVRLIMPSATDNWSSFSTLGAVQQVSVPGDNVLRQFKLTFPLTGFNYFGLGVEIDGQTGLASGSMIFKLMQLEVGDVATSFEQLPIGETFELCRRYARRYQTVQNTADLAFQMRATPLQSGAGPYLYDAEL